MTNRIIAIYLYFIGTAAAFSCESPPPAKDTALYRENTTDSAILKQLVREKHYTVSEFLNSEAQSDSFEAGAGSHLFLKINLPARLQNPGIETAILLHQDSVSMLFQKKNGSWFLADTFSVRFLCMQQRNTSYYCSIPEVWTEDFNHDGLEDIALTKSYGFSGRCPHLIFLNHGDGNIRLANPDFDLVEPEYDTLRQQVVCFLTGHSPYYREGTIFSLRHWKVAPLRKITIESNAHSDEASGVTAHLYEGRKNVWILTQKRTFNSNKATQAFVERNWPY